MPDTTVSSMLLAPVGASTGSVNNLTSGSIHGDGSTAGGKSFLSALQSVTPAAKQVVSEAGATATPLQTANLAAVDVSVDGVFQFRYTMLNKLATQKTNIESESLPTILPQSNSMMVVHESHSARVSLPEFLSGSGVEGVSSVLTDSLNASFAVLGNNIDGIQGEELDSSSTTVKLAKWLDESELADGLEGHLTGYANSVDLLQQPQPLTAAGAAAQSITAGQTGELHYLSWANRQGISQASSIRSLLGDDFTAQTTMTANGQPSSAMSSTLLNSAVTGSSAVTGANTPSPGFTLQNFTDAALGEFVEFLDMPEESNPVKLDARSFAAAPSLSVPGLNPELRLAGERLQVPVDVQFSNQQWPSAMAEKAAQLVSQRISTADIQLDPPELGPLQVRVQVHQDQVSVNFIAQNAQVRDALDLSLARLRDMLQDQGLSLVDSGVSDQSGNEGGAEQDSQQRGESMVGSLLSEDDATDATSNQTITVPWGIDHFV